jgi:hypothetical protein
MATAAGIQQYEKRFETVQKHLATLFDGSEQGIYLYLDDHHVAANATLAKWLGYKSPAEWAKENAVQTIDQVAPKDQENLATAFQNAMERGMATVTKLSWKKKDGKWLKLNLILVPFDFDGERFALHFVEKA